MATTAVGLADTAEDSPLRQEAIAQPVAALQGVTKTFGEVRALDNVTLEVAPGRLTAVLGPNGAGKTTAVKILLGLLRPTKGTVRVFGRDPRESANRTRVGVMLQASKVPETLRVREHIELFASYYPNPLPVRDVLAAAGLSGVENRLFGRLSGGERQRVLFALSLCGDPDLLFLDEPTVGLDVESRRGFWTHIQKLVKHGRSIVLTTHYLEEADALADRLIVLHRGRILADGSPAEVKRLVAEKRIRCVTSLGPTTLLALPGVIAVERDRNAVVIRSHAAEATLRELISRDSGLTELEVRSVGLEDAFLALTSNGAAAANAPETRGR